MKRRRLETRGRKQKTCLRRLAVWKSAGLSVLCASMFLLVACGGGGGGGGGGAAPTPAPPPAPPPALPALPAVILAPFVGGLSFPVGLESPPDGTPRMFVVEQAGTIKIIQSGALLPTPFLDISARVVSVGEQGLLGLAFHPDFATNGRFFVYYTRGVSPAFEIVISEFKSLSANVGDPNSERELLTVPHPTFANHNGGQIAFGPDGFLYIGVGDGGSGGDPNGNGQNTQTRLGKMLRIDVTPLVGYAIPADNPFAAGGGLPEIWAYGLRNPWRFSFDQPTGRLFCADVGQSTFEEVNLVTRGGNFGWNKMEGTICYPPGTASCDTAGLSLPITEYGHDAAGGSAVIGGFVYRGTAIPGLVGTYLFGDFSSGNVWGLRQDAQGAWQRTLMFTHSLAISAFGRDAAAELYLVDYGNGEILRIVPGP
jgi:glucose/arabinose dehydrogenase